MAAETLWFPYYLVTVKRLQRRHPAYHATTDPNTRRALLVRCLDALEAASCPETRINDMKRVIAGWFLGNISFDQIQRDNISSWVAWAFLDEDLDTIDSDKRVHVDDLVSLIEERLGHVFAPGSNPAAKCIRLTLDPVQATHRPLVYYLATKCLNAVGTRLLYQLGFYYRTLDPMDVAGSGTLRYLYRPATEPTLLGSTPIVFVHGIGIGFAAYLQLLARLPRNVPIYLLEWPHVSMQLQEQVPTIPDTLNFLSGMLRRDKHPRATFVAHSLGTVAVSWILKSPLHRNLVSSVVLLDPVTFLLCDPAIAYNFLYRPPTSVLELLMSYFVSREMYIAHSLSRHFHWSKNILFYDELPLPTADGRGGRNAVLLAGHDAIVPAPRVKAYLAAHHSQSSETLLDVLYYPTRHHGELLLRKSMLDPIMSKILIACGSNPHVSFSHRRMSCRRPAPLYRYKPAWKVVTLGGEKPRIMVVSARKGWGTPSV
ncbi:hypothetical protein SpCBS45565_g06028 [Spizellomyces sp. 'palustris']|nr:hypothetical protein SpCBS45565_g06028 [Spizellomyces sp. 'palustris']